MTTDNTKKFRVLRPALLILVMAGITEALLLARLVARLLAARPDNPTITALYAVTNPLIIPLSILDTRQPRFGAVLEFSTLVLAIIVPLAAYLLWYLIHPRAA